MIETAVQGAPDTDALNDPVGKDIRQSALKRVGKALEHVRMTIKQIGSDIYNQVHPSPALPQLKGDFDECAKEVSKFLDTCLDNFEKDENGTKQGSSAAHKFGKGMKKIVVHIAPFAKFLVKLGKQDGLVICLLF